MKHGTVGSQIVNVIRIYQKGGVHTHAQNLRKDEIVVFVARFLLIGSILILLVSKSYSQDSGATISLEVRDQPVATLRAEALGPYVFSYGATFDLHVLTTPSKIGRAWRFSARIGFDNGWAPFTRDDGYEYTDYNVCIVGAMLLDAARVEFFSGTCYRKLASLTGSNQSWGIGAPDEGPKWIGGAEFLYYLTNYLGLEGRVTLSIGDNHTRTVLDYLGASGVGVYVVWDWE